MFRERIESPIDPIPVEYTNTLNRLSNEPDYSLTCLGIALLKRRIENYKGIAGDYVTFANNGEAINFVKEAFKNSCNVEVPVLDYVIYNSHNADVEMNVDGLIHKTTIENFMKTKTETECSVLYSEDRNYAAILINSRDIRMYHVLISFLQLYFPKLFEIKADEQEYDLVKALSNKEKDNFVARLQILVEKYKHEFRTIQLTQLLKQIHEKKLNEAEESIRRKNYDIDQIRDSYADAIRMLKSLIIEFEGLKATEQFDKAEEDLVEYLSENKQVRNLRVRNGRIEFSVTSDLVNFDTETWELFSDRGYIYDGEYRTNLPEEFCNKDNRKRLLDSIFSENAEFVVKIAGNYSLDIDGCVVRTRSDYEYETMDPIYKDYLPNPHLKLFSCLGGYETRIADVLRNRNYISAVEMCICSAGSVDLDETDQTFRPFIGWLLKSDRKVLRRKDGVEMTPSEALLWLIDKEKANETN